MALLVLTVTARRRKKADTPAPVVAATRALQGSPAAMPDLLPYLRQHRQTFTYLLLGLMSVMLGFAAVGGWLAVIYQRVFMQTPQQLGAMLGAVGLASTAAGFVISVYGMRFFTPRIGPRLNMRVLWLASLWAALAFTTMTFATQAWHMYTIHGVYVTLLTGATMIYPTVIQTVAPSLLRARLFAAIAVMISVCGAAAPPLVGLLSDQFKHLPNGLILAAAMIAVPFLSLGALFLFLCEKPYVKTKEAAELMDAEADATPIDSVTAETSRA
jgi:MFS family permease